MWQIEQFIESVFPTQDPRAILLAAGQEVGTATTGISEQEKVKRAAEDKEARRDVLYLGLATLALLGTLSIFMVSFIFLQLTLGNEMY